MADYLQSQVERALQYYGENILTKEGELDCVVKFGLQVYKEAHDLYVFRQSDHPIPEYWRNQAKKRIEEMAGIATSKTKLS